MPLPLTATAEEPEPIDHKELGLLALEYAEDLPPYSEAKPAVLLQAIAHLLLAQIEQRAETDRAIAEILAAVTPPEPFTLNVQAPAEPDPAEAPKPRPRPSRQKETPSS
ncbi:hypothetical protein N1031_06770 [Herbiconiux moechotypicola]|uniref:Uncharacterized protein n=1 Tax=Herbiconiux moechotypicola TaxID=637393 RepID=A0ABN3DFR5_9MICO|nr:hypothetical protein [Herbiconiux moechotypicola]MCS5729460.1 hypothetical protein [Herbiconiux moechotypicola]